MHISRDNVLQILGTLAVGMSLAVAYLNLVPLTGASLNPGDAYTDFKALGHETATHCTPTPFVTAEAILLIRVPPSHPFIACLPVRSPEPGRGGAEWGVALRPVGLLRWTTARGRLGVVHLQDSLHHRYHRAQPHFRHLGPAGRGRAWLALKGNHGSATVL
jgi:hypothetical protein